MTEQFFEVKRFFDRPGDQVLPELAETWYRAEDPAVPLKGSARVLGLQVGSMARYFRIKEAALYSHKETMDRWKDSRGPEIQSLEPGEVITYNSRGRILTFIKTQEAENIMPSLLQEIDKFGVPLQGKEHTLTSSQIAPLVGLGHRMRGRLTPLYFRGETALILSTGGREITQAELEALERELLAEIEDMKVPPLNP